MSQADMDAINAYMNNTPAKTKDALTIKNAWFAWWPTLSWYDKMADGAYDDARAKRDAFNTANVTSDVERLNLERVQTTGLRSEDVAASGAQLLGDKGAKSVVRPASASPALHSTLKRGMTGNEVKIWQRAINLNPDGDFGRGTEAATKTFQAAHGLLADGVVGPKTWLAAYALTPSVPMPVAVVDKTGAFPTAVAPAPIKNGSPVPYPHSLVYSKPEVPMLTPRVKVAAAVKQEIVTAAQTGVAKTEGWFHKLLHFLHIVK